MFVELLLVEHKIIISVPKADVHNSFRNLNLALFQSFAKSISTLTDEEFLDFGILILCKLLSEFNTNLSVEYTVDVLRPEMNFFQLRYSSVAPGEVRRKVFATKFFLLDELTDFVLILREKISSVVIRILVVTSVLVTQINSRDKLAVIILSDVLLTPVVFVK